MRKGLTLIELILSMVIIGVVFSVVPKIIYVSNKSMQLSKKEDALFNAYSLMGSIVKLSWDENTLHEGKILDTNETTCEDYRIGGFEGSRNCIDSDENASDIGREDENYNDIDDYDATNNDVNNSYGNIYDINVSVNYVDSNYTIKSDKMDRKEIIVVVYPGEDNKRMKNFQSSFFYYSTNLGHIQIKKEQWK